MLGRVCSGTIAAMAAMLASSAFAQPTTRVSVDPAGVGGDGPSFEPAISADGDLVVFASRARNIDPADDNLFRIDVFLRNLASGTTTLLSRGTDGALGDGDSRFPTVSNDGGQVAFASTATTFDPADGNFEFDVYVRDRDADVTTLISRALGGGAGDGSSSVPVISGDGRFVAFVSRATDLVSGDTNGEIDVFVADRDADGDGALDEGPPVIRRVSLRPDGSQASGAGVDAAAFIRPDFSSGARYLAFASRSPELVAGDGNMASDIFVRDRDPDEDGIFDEPNAFTIRVSVASDGGEANADSVNPAISGDGRFIVFASDADNLVAGDDNGATDVFVHDRDVDEDGVFDEAGLVETRRISVSSAGEQGNGPSVTPSLSEDGRYAAFASDADNLVRCDVNDARDVFIHDLRLSKTRVASVDTAGRLADDDSALAALSRDGRFIAFSSLGANLVAGDINCVEDVFHRDLRPLCQEVEPNDTPLQCTVIDFRECDVVIAKLQKDCVFDIVPKVGLRAFGKPKACRDEDGFIIPNRFSEPIVATGGSSLQNVPPDSAGLVRLGVSAFADVFDGAINGLASNAPHGEVGLVVIEVFYDYADPGDEPCFGRDRPAQSFTVDLREGNHAERISFNVPSNVESVDIFARTDRGTVEVAYDVDFYIVENLEPNRPYCLTIVGGVGESMAKTDTILGLFDEHGALIELNDDGPRAPYSELCVFSDDEGDIRFSVTGGGDLDFNGLADARQRDYFDLLRLLFFVFDLDAAFEPGASVKDGSAGCVIRYPRDVWDEFFSPGEPPEKEAAHGVCGEYCVQIRPAFHVDAPAKQEESPERALRLAADLNDDGAINAHDLATLLSMWGPVR